MPTNFPPSFYNSKSHRQLACVSRRIGNWIDLTLRLFRHEATSAVAMAAATFCFAATCNAQSIDFIRDVQPILEAACIKCHGPLRQEGEYRLDVREIALEGGASYAPNIILGNATDSPLIHFVAGQIDGLLMPAKGERLTDKQVDILRTWIDQGASWPDSANIKAEKSGAWWSLQPLSPARVPKHSSTHHPIDAFVRTKLDEHALAPAPRASKSTLIRRVYFDLLGLPPTPAEIEAFVADDDPNAYQLLIDRLLASPRYGERWARHWMDAAHFAETHGHDQDRVREHAWPYRDYLIEAYNDDTPYKKFVHEQIAADVLAPNEPRKIAALGFLAAGPWDESTLRDIREDTIDREIGRYVDRDDMLTNVMSNFTSLTVHCARCHDHKFDPISQSEYYSLQAVFAGVERANRSYDADASIQNLRELYRKRKEQLAETNEQLRRELLDDAVQRSVTKWEQQTAGRNITWQLLENVTAESTDGSTLTVQPDGSFLASGTRPDRDTYMISGFPKDGRITGIRLQVLADPSLPLSGPGRQDNGNLHLSELQVSIEVTPGANALIPIVRADADFDQADWGVAKAIDGNPDTAWGIHPKVGMSHEAVFEFAAPLDVRSVQKVTVWLKQLHGRGHLIGRPRISFTSDNPPLRVSQLPEEIAEILSIKPIARSEEQRFQLALFEERDRVSRELSALPKSMLVYAAAADFEPDGSLKPPPGPRPIHRLARGDIRSPKELAFPGALNCIGDLPAKFEIADSMHESVRRAALAKWLTDDRNPLIWRSIVNRIWQQHFGRGIVETANDFGRLGSKPTHPELLDWLAADFRDSGQSIKLLHRKIMTSETYQQSASASELGHAGSKAAREDQAKSLDTDNRLLWRMNRIRLDAECVRDAMLATSGQLDFRMGGPSDRQFDLKPGRHVTPVIDYGLFDLDGPFGKRRSVYRFLFRTLPDPFMEALDCPAGDQIQPTRTNSVTVQQVLAMWNDAFVLKQAEHLATRLKTERSTTEERIAWAVRLALGRDVSTRELERFTGYANQHGLENFCRLLFNTNEFMFID